MHLNMCMHDHPRLQHWLFSKPVTVFWRAYKEAVNWTWRKVGRYKIDMTPPWQYNCTWLYFKDMFFCLFWCFLSCQCSTQEFYLITSTLSRLSAELQALMPAIQSQLSSALLKNLLLDTPQLLSPAHNFLKVLDEKAAKWVMSLNILTSWIFT